mgnify:CR=1 FL=1
MKPRRICVSGDEIEGDPIMSEEGGKKNRARKFSLNVVEADDISRQQ